MDLKTKIFGIFLDSWFSSSFQPRFIESGRQNKVTYQISKSMFKSWMAILKQETRREEKNYAFSWNVSNILDHDYYFYCSDLAGEDLLQK